MLRLKLTTRLLTVVIAVALAIVHAAAQSVAAEHRPTAHSVGEISMTVADLDRSVGFYSRVLTFQKVGGHSDERVRTAEMRLGDEAIELVKFKGKQGRPVPADSRSNDLWFQHVAIIVSDMDRAYAVLEANHVEHASIAPQRLPDWNKNAAGIRAFYFKDPDGHPLEILQFPDGKGDPKWHIHSDKLFLGIDHTAIVVADTEASLKFYRDLLGFRVASGGENYGPEQERLNSVPGAHLRITTLRAPSGPGIELLEYQAPRNGRRLSYRSQIADLVHRHTTLYSADPAMLARTLHATTAPAEYGAGNAWIIHDPDGHELLVRSTDKPVSIGEVK